MSAVSVDGPLTPSLQLSELAELRHRDPATVRTRCAEMLEGTSLTPAERARAHWVHGLAVHELGEPEKAVEDYREAVALAEEAGDRDVESRARASLAISLLYVGHGEEAEREIARADRLAPEAARGLVDLLRGLILQRMGHLEESVGVYDRAVDRLRRDGDDANLTRVLVNRGCVLAYRGAFDRAMADLVEAEGLATRLGLWRLVAMSAHNQGFTSGRRGRVPEALAAFDRAEIAFRESGMSSANAASLAADRSLVLLGVGLTADARSSAQLALEVLGEGADTAELGESQLLLGRACLADGDLDAAMREASAAAAVLRQAGRLPWAAFADYVSLQAEVLATEDLAGPPDESLLGRSEAIAELLADQGWPVEAAHARTFHARVALALGRADVARAALSGVARARSGGTAELRVQAWHATALLRLADGDRAGAKRALGRGLDVIDEHRAGLASSEARAGIAAHGRDLARMGVRLSMDGGRPWDLLRWSERWRAGALRQPPVTPSDDVELTTALEELRETRSALREATLAAEPTATLERRVTALEKSVRDSTLRTSGAGALAPFRLDRAELVAALGGTTLVEYVVVDQRLLAVTVSGGRARVHDLAPVDAVAGEVRFLLFALRGLLARGGSDDRFVVAAQRLDGLLLAPLRLPPGEVVIVPTGALHGLCWSALPTLHGRAVTITPSAELWCRRARVVRPPRRVALVAGPDLPGADREVDHLSGLYPGADLLVGRDATVVGVLGALAGSDTVHLAAHGLFRADSPLFSHLRLVDGTLTVYELERLRATPSTLVLAACDAMRADVLDGDELLGTATAMLGLGVDSVVVPVTAVPDEATAELMLSLHEGLSEGLRPSTALARATAAQDGHPYRRAVASTFVCLGAGELPDDPGRGDDDAVDRADAQAQ